MYGQDILFGISMFTFEIPQKLYAYIERYNHSPCSMMKLLAHWFKSSYAFSKCPQGPLYSICRHENFK